MAYSWIGKFEPDETQIETLAEKLVKALDKRKQKTEEEEHEDDEG